MSVKFFIVLQFQEILQDAVLKEVDMETNEVLLVIKDWTNVSHYLSIKVIKTIVYFEVFYFMF